MSAELELSITNIETQHPRYFPGRYLLAEDFTQQHDYLNHRLRYTNKSLHVSGIIEGLEVGIGARNEYVTIAAGAAIDNQGNMIVIKEDKTFNDFNQLSHGFLYVQYSRDEEGMQTQNGNSEEFTRWSEDPIIGFNAETQPESAVLLAEIDIAEDGFLEITDRRKYSGLSIPCKEGEDITLRYGGRKNFINKAVLTGSLHIKNNLTVGEDQGNGTNEPRPLLEVRGELKLETGVAVNQISADQTMEADSDSIIPTQKAIRTYIDQAIGNAIGGLFVKGMIMLWPVVRSSSRRGNDEFLQLPEHWKDCDGRDGRPDLNGVLVCGVCQTENTLEVFYDKMRNNLGMNEMEYRASGEELDEYLYSWPGRPSDIFPSFPGSVGPERDLGERWEGYKLVQRNVPNHQHAGYALGSNAGYHIVMVTGSSGPVCVTHNSMDSPEYYNFRKVAEPGAHRNDVYVGVPSETESVKEGLSVLGFPRPPLIVLRYIIYWPD